MSTRAQQPTRLLRPWDSLGKSTGVGCYCLLQCMKVKSESEIAQSCPTLSDPWTAVYQASPSMGFSGQAYWSGLPLPSPTEAKVVSKTDVRTKAGEDAPHYLGHYICFSFVCLLKGHSFFTPLNLFHNQEIKVEWRLTDISSSPLVH